MSDELTHSLFQMFTSLVSSAREMFESNPFWAALVVLGAAGMLAICAKSLGK